MSEETIPQMREAIEAANKRVKELEDTVSSKDQELRVRDAREAFRDAGYNPKHGDLFANDPNQNGEITAEAVAAYADQWDLAPASVDGKQDASAEEGDSTGDQDDSSDTFSSMDRSGTRAGDGGGGSSTEQSLTRQEWMELQASDPVAASQALRQGRVLISTSENLKSGQTASVGGNPYETQHSVA